MNRDRRLLIPLGLMVVSFVALAVQALIVNHYIFSSVMDHNWEGFSAIYGVEPPALNKDIGNGMTVTCLDYCAPKLPFIPGWIGIVAFLGSIMSLFIIWFRPRP